MKESIPNPSETTLIPGTPVAMPEIEDSKNREIFRGFFEEMDQMGLIPLTIIQGSEATDIVALGTGAQLKRPFAVFEVSPQSDHSLATRYVYKTEVPGKRDPGIRRELLFYRTLKTMIKTGLPKGMEEEIVFPELAHAYTTPEGPKGIVMTKIEGKITGTATKADPETLTIRDADRIVALIQAVQQISLESIPDRSHLPERDYEKDETKYFDRHLPLIRELFGEESAQKAKALFRRSLAAEKQQPLRLQSEDVFTINLVKMADGRLGSFDWERLHLGKNPAYDYTKMIAHLWSAPEVQRAMLRKAIATNTEIPNFRTMLASSLALREGTYLLNQYQTALREHDADPQKFEHRQDFIEEARQGKVALLALIKEILDGKGIWEENK